MSLRLGIVPTIVVSSAAMAKEVMKTHDLVFASRPSLLGQQKLSYNGLDLAFAPYGDYWREMRKICTIHLFSSNMVKSFCPILEDEVSRMVKKISISASSSELVNLSEILMTLSSTVICRAAFGRRYEEEGCERSRFHSVLNEAQAILGSFFFTDYFPSILGYWVDKVTGVCGRFDKCFKELDSFFQEIINDHLHPNRPKSDQEDFIDVLLRLRNENLLTIDLTWDHIKAILMNVFIGGTDTTAATTVWAMTALMKNPNVMKKVQEEIRNVVGKKDIVGEDDLHKLPYLKAVVKETIRLHPTVLLLVPREAIQACNLDGYEIPPKTVVYVNAWSIGRDPKSWENPEEFLPERFLGNLIDFKGQNFELIPFGAGRRGCLGIHMGAVIVELALANLLYSFDWELPAKMKKEDIDTDVIPGVAMHKKNALCLLARN